MRILIVHPGYSLPRHFNYHEAMSMLLKDMYSAEIDILACESAVKACGFRSGLGLRVDSRFKIIGGRIGCWKCQRKLKNRAGGFCDKFVSVNDHLSRSDYKEAKIIADGLVGMVSVEDILKLEVCDVNIGTDIWQSIQRYLFVGTPELIPINKKNVAHEFIITGVLYAIAVDRILSENRYDYILTNERAYIEWGVTTRVALEKGIPVIHTGQDYFTGYGYEGLNVVVLRSVEEISGLFYAPRKNVIDKIFNDDSLIKKYSLLGKEALQKWLCGNKLVRDENNIGRWFREERKTVVVFTHLCWDASVTFGDMLYASFEVWLCATYQIALDNDSVDWIFRVHPAEVNASISEDYNTYKLLLKLSNENPCDHIKIMSGEVDITAIELIPKMHAGITALGTVSFELPALGVPCVVASRSGYATFEFTISGDSQSEYEEIISNIVDIKAPTDRQTELAEAYAGLAINDYYLLSMTGLFDLDDANDPILDRERVEKWVTSKVVRRKMQRILEGDMTALL